METKTKGKSGENHRESDRYLPYEYLNLLDNCVLQPMGVKDMAHPHEILSALYYWCYKEINQSDDIPEQVKLINELNYATFNSLMSLFEKEGLAKEVNRRQCVEMVAIMSCEGERQRRKSPEK